MEETNVIRTQKRTALEKEELIHRLNRAEGQVRGIKRMIENDIYSDEVLAQAQAAQAAINSFTKELLKGFAETYVREDLKNGSDEKLEELLYLVYRIIR